MSLSPFLRCFNNAADIKNQPKSHFVFTVNSATTSCGGLKQTRRDLMTCRPLDIVLAGRRHPCSGKKKLGEAVGLLPAGVWVWRWNPLTLLTTIITSGVCQTLH